MKKKILVYIVFLTVGSFRLPGQQISCTLAGQTESFLIDLKQVNIAFTTNLLTSEQNKLVATESLLLPLEERSSERSNRAIFPLRANLSTEEVYTLIARLNSRPGVDYASLVLKYKDGTVQCVSDQIIVRLKQAAARIQLDSMARQYGGEIVSAASMFKSPNRIAEGFMEEIQILKLPREQVINALEIAGKINALELSDYAEPNFIRYMNQFTNDPDYSLLWAHSKIDVPGAWAITPGGSSSITVAVIDDGVDLNHPDLLGNVVSGYDATFSSAPGGQLSFNSFGAPVGNDAHGTACAGIIGAIANNGKGGVGIAYNCKILPVRVLRSASFSDDLILADGINQAWLWGADVLSNSWGGGSPSSLIENAIHYAAVSGRGGLGSPVFFSTGNENWNVSAPATYFKAIAVGATTTCDSRKRSGNLSGLGSCTGSLPSPDPLGVSCGGEPCWGSNYGLFLDIAAPGIGIATTDPTGAAGYETGDYTYGFNGTSAACPHAAGVMALILSINPGLTHDQARFAIESTCDKVGGYNYYSTPSQPADTWSNQLGYGRINAQAAVAYAQSLLPVPVGAPLVVSLTAPSTLCWGSGSLPTLTLKITGGNPVWDSNSNKYYYNINLFDSHSGSGAGTYSNSAPPVLSSYAGPFANVPTFLNLDFSAINSFPYVHTYYLDVWGTDLVHYYTPITINVNRNPTVTLAADLFVCKGSNITLGTGAQITGGTPPYTYQWNPVTSNLSNPTIVNCVATNIQSTETYTLTAVDNLGCSGNDKITVNVSQVTANAGPDKNVCIGSSPQTIGLQSTGGFSPYTYSWSPSIGLSNSTIYNPIVTVSSPGTYNYTITVTDAAGCTSSDQITITALSVSPIVVNAGPDINGVCAGTALILNGTASGGSGSYTYAWKNGSTTISSTATTTTYPTAPATYTLIVTDINGCIGQDQVNLLGVFPTPVISSIYFSGTASSYGTHYRCVNGPGMQLNVGVYNGIQPYSYLWSPVSGLSDPTIGNPIASPSIGTIYKVTVTDVNGCSAVSTAPTIAVFTAPPDVDFYFDKNCCPMLEYVNTTKVHCSLGYSSPLNHPSGAVVTVPQNTHADWNNGPGVIPEYSWNPFYFNGHPYFPVGFRDISLTVKTFDSFSNVCYSATRTKSAYVLPTGGGSSNCSVLTPISPGSTASACGTYAGTSLSNDKMAVTVNNSCPTIISVGARATYIGGSGGVTLNPGFEAVPGSNFWAFIETGPCMPPN